MPGNASCNRISDSISGNLFIRPLSYFLGADSENIIYVLPYLRCIVSYAPVFMLDVFLMTYIKNEGHPNVAMVSTVTGTVLNIILDCIFVFVFKWGMFGAAFAACIGSACSSVITISYILKKHLNLIPRIKNICGNLIPRSEQNYKKAHAFRRYALISSLVAGTLYLLIGYTFTEPLITVFSKDTPELIQQAVYCFKLYLPAYFFMGIGITVGMYFQAMEASTKSLVIMMMRGIVMPVAGAFILPLIFDKTGLWISMPFAELAVAGIAALFLVQSDRQEQDTMTFSHTRNGERLRIMT